MTIVRMIKQQLIDEATFCAILSIAYVVEFLLSKGSIPLFSDLHAWALLSGMAATGIGTYWRREKAKNASKRKVKIGLIPIDIEEISPQQKPYQERPIDKSQGESSDNISH